MTHEDKPSGKKKSKQKDRGPEVEKRKKSHLGGGSRRRRGQEQKMVSTVTERKIKRLSNREEGRRNVNKQLTGEIVC